MSGDEMSKEYFFRKTAVMPGSDLYAERDSGTGEGVAERDTAKSETNWHHAIVEELDIRQSQHILRYEIAHEGDRFLYTLRGANGQIMGRFELTSFQYPDPMESFEGMDLPAKSVKARPPGYGLKISFFMGDPKLNPSPMMFETKVSSFLDLLHSGFSALRLPEPEIKPAESGFQGGVKMDNTNAYIIETQDKEPPITRKELYAALRELASEFSLNAEQEDLLRLLGIMLSGDAAAEIVYKRKYDTVPNYNELLEIFDKTLPGACYGRLQQLILKYKASHSLSMAKTAGE